MAPRMDTVITTQLKARWFNWGKKRIMTIKTGRPIKNISSR
jgi:hypothetical protein